MNLVSKFNDIMLIRICDIMKCAKKADHKYHTKFYGNVASGCLDILL